MSKKWLRIVSAFVAAAILATGLTFTPVQSARADACGYEDWPTSGSLETVHLTGGDYVATFRFTLTGSQLSALQCRAELLEIDFHIQGFLLSPSWDGYTVQATNLPGAIHDTAAFDISPFEATPAVTRIYTHSLTEGKTYFVRLAWSGSTLTQSGTTPSFSITWIPSHWPSGWDQQLFCSAFHGNGDAWCIFPVGRAETTTLGPGIVGLPNGRLSFNGSKVHKFGLWNSNPASQPADAPGAYTPPPPPPPPTLSLTQSVGVSSGELRAYQPFNFTYKVKNTSGGAASIQRLVVAVRGPSGNALDVICAGGTAVTLQPNQEFVCNANLPTGYGQAGQYYYWPDWLGYDGSWHAGQLSAGTYLTLGTPFQISMVEPISVGPSDNVSIYTPLQWSYRIRNTSGVPASLQRVVVAVRGPSGDALDVLCAGGNGVTLQPDQEWTCDAQLPSGYGSIGNFTFWADWLDFNGTWHQGQLGANRPLTLANSATLFAVQPVSVGPSNYRPKLTPLWWSYRVRNTSTGYASIQRLVVAVRGPGGDPLDVQCLNGTGVTLAPNQEWTCDAQLPSGYGSTGNFTFWADWLGYNGQWHYGQLGGTSVVTLY